MAPSLLHEASIQVRLQTGEMRILHRRTEERGGSGDVAGALQQEVTGPHDRQCQLSMLGVLGGGRLALQLPPRVGLCKQRLDVGPRAYPRRVSHLQVEASASEHGCEIELPVEEPVVRGDALRDVKPRVFGYHRR